MNLNSIKFIGSRIPEDEVELCKEMFFRAGKEAQKYFLGHEVEGTDCLYIKLTVYCEQGIDDFAEVAPALYREKKSPEWRNVQMSHCDFYRLVEMGGGGFVWEEC